MNVKTRGEKIDEMLTSVKRFLITAMLVIWGLLTFALGVNAIGKNWETKQLNNRINELEVQLKNEKETESTETTYVYVDGHKYMVVDTAW